MKPANPTFDLFSNRTRLVKMATAVSREPCRFYLLELCLYQPESLSDEHNGSRWVCRCPFRPTDNNEMEKRKRIMRFEIVSIEIVVSQRSLARSIIQLGMQSDLAGSLLTLLRSTRSVAGCKSVQVFRVSGTVRFSCLWKRDPSKILTG